MLGFHSDHLQSMSYTTAINDYAIIVQEYFQQRVQLWLETIGKDVFGIDPPLVTI